MHSEYYITAIKLSKKKDGTEYVSHVKVHAKVGHVIKEQGQKLEKDLVISLMPKIKFYAAKKDKKGKWISYSRVTVFEGDDDYYLAGEPHDLEELPNF